MIKFLVIIQSTKSPISKKEILDSDEENFFNLPYKIRRI